MRVSAKSSTTSLVPWRAMTRFAAQKEQTPPLKLTMCFTTKKRTRLWASSFLVLGVVWWSGGRIEISAKLVAVDLPGAVRRGSSESELFDVHEAAVAVVASDSNVKSDVI